MNRKDDTKDAASQVGGNLTIGIVEDCAVERLHLSTLIGNLPGYVIKFEADSVETARQCLVRFRPDILLLDLFWAGKTASR